MPPPADEDYKGRVEQWRAWALFCFTKNDAPAQAMTDRELMALVSLMADPVTHSQPESLDDKDRALIRKALTR